MNLYFEGVPFRTLSEDALGDLNRPFSETEVVFSLKGMYPTKSLGHDGLYALFYSKY